MTPEGGAGAEAGAAPAVEEQGAAAPTIEDANAETGAAAQALEQDIAELQTKASERDEYLALAQRTQADFENYRKRAAKDLGAAERRGVARLARELLPALDNLSRALAAAQDGTKSASGIDSASVAKAGTGTDAAGVGELREGIRLVHGELKAALARMGVEAYSPEGERFDPELHEAVAQQPVQGAESGTIVEVYEPGYRHEGSVLRAAKVVVAQ